MIAPTRSEKRSGAAENMDRSHTPPFSIGSDRFIALQTPKVINRKSSCSILLTLCTSPSTQIIEARHRTLR